jgi:hypothetical protein
LGLEKRRLPAQVLDLLRDALTPSHPLIHLVSMGYIGSAAEICAVRERGDADLRGSMTVLPMTRYAS